MRFLNKIPVLIGSHRFSYVAGLAAFLFVTLSLGASHRNAQLTAERAER